jgi:hypothetical protein
VVNSTSGEKEAAKLGEDMKYREGGDGKRPEEREQTGEGRGRERN